MYYVLGSSVYLNIDHLTATLASVQLNKQVYFQSHKYCLLLVRLTSPLAADTLDSVILLFWSEPVSHLTVELKYQQSVFQNRRLNF